MLMKRCEKEPSIFRKIFGVIPIDDEDIDDDDDQIVDDDQTVPNDKTERLLSLLGEAYSESRQDCIHFILHNPHGRAMLAAVIKTKEPKMSATETLRKFVNDGGDVELHPVPKTPS
jgi:hypothetical protein